MQIILLILHLTMFSNAGPLTPKLDIPEVSCDQAMANETLNKIYTSFSDMECWNFKRFGSCTLLVGGGRMALLPRVLKNFPNSKSLTAASAPKQGSQVMSRYRNMLSDASASGAKQGPFSRSMSITESSLSQAKYYSGRLLEKLRTVAPKLQAAGITTVVIGGMELLQIRGDEISKCAGDKVVELYVSTVDEKEGCSTLPVIGAKELDFLALPFEKQRELLSSNKYLCSHYKNVSENLELVTQAQNELWFKDVSVRDIKCSDSSHVKSYTLTSKKFDTPIQFERKTSQDSGKKLKVTYRQNNESYSSELEYSKDGDWTDLNKVTWDNKLPAWRGSRAIPATQFEVVSEWNDRPYNDAIRYNYLNDYWGEKAQSCCEMKEEQRTSCIADLDVRPSKKTTKAKSSK